MLMKFTVSNYAGFKDEFEFDLTSKKRYAYNQDMVRNKIVQKSLIYGPNGSGKSSLCMAIMDITFHVVDKEKLFLPPDSYFYVGNNKNSSKFTYTFCFDKKIIKYEYVKSTPTTLIYEKINIY